MGIRAHKGNKTQDKTRQDTDTDTDRDHREEKKSHERQFETRPKEKDVEQKGDSVTICFIMFKSLFCVTVA